MTPEIFMAICAGVTLLLYFTATVIGSVVFIFRKIDTSIGEAKKEILEDVAHKHAQNEVRYEALNTLVARHDILLQPEFLGRQRHGH